MVVVGLWDWSRLAGLSVNQAGIRHVVLPLILLLPVVLVNLLTIATTVFVVSDVSIGDKVVYSHLKAQFREYVSQPFGERGSQHGYFLYNTNRLLTSFLIPRTFVASGVFTDYFENGVKGEQGQMYRNRLEGRYQRWYESGKPYLEANFVDGRVEGIVTVWHADGQKWSEGEMKSGKPVGTESWSYNTRGELSSEKAAYNAERALLLVSSPQSLVQSL
jgi:hypothetical protein